MANLREAYAATSLASLEMDAERERAIDRVAAAGRCPTLGVNIWKARYMLESKAYQDALGQLRLHFSDRYRAESLDIAKRIVEQCFHEFLVNACKDCNGAKELMAGELRVICETCEGSGIRRYTDFERARSMKLSMQRVKSLNHKLNWLLGEIQSMDNQVNTIMAAELER